ncbi:hypothetical protein GFC01_01090 [Desulfofundulus thermobenzoicus]|uniref:DUF5320 domain-containing protein n=1 Tax=Desulfofundulus thermobenzoicus TaxID=29376 RepID=A0A6N7ILN4_9FIRM|nr:DUF5320 domain-containing protein [Desulfofundulus thermobenzoicus]MQL50892.1 hypothetical protein [Desulfofundulus thermobenzoicus]
MRGDGTGPWGMGPLTGRGMGYCAGFNMPGYANPGGWWRPRWGGARGMGRRGRFGGRGWWWGGAYTPAVYQPYPPANPDPQREKGLLESQISHLESMLAGLKQRLTQIQGEQKGQKEQD